ncbi:MAG: L,D-transpeptidase family protein [Armatimonadetes bacterium]|nr:L,D-transpeptidase family protein [Armatimonadota bacterium]
MERRRLAWLAKLAGIVVVLFFTFFAGGSSLPPSPGIVLHRTGGPDLPAREKAGLAACKFEIGPDGTVVSHPKRKNSTFSGFDRKYIGIVLAGDPAGYYSPPPEAQWKATASLIRSLKKKHGISWRHIASHRELEEEVYCPGEHLPVDSLEVSLWKEETGIPEDSLLALCRRACRDFPLTGATLVVEKSKKTLALYLEKTLLRSYPVVIGFGGAGSKEKSGDGKTPEGTYRIVEKAFSPDKKAFLGSRWLGLDYPNREDADRGLASGTIGRDEYDSITGVGDAGVLPPQETGLGGWIGIHGYPDWAPLDKGETQGCIAMRSSDLEELYLALPLGTPVVIRP